MELKEIYQKAKKEVSKINRDEFLKYLKNCSEGARNDILSKDGASDYYLWLVGLMRVLRPWQVVELGGAMGASALCMLYGLPKDSIFYSITLEEDGLEFSFIKESYPQLIKVIGDDLDLACWPKDLGWKATEVLFIDTKHEGNQLRQELDLYLPLLSKGTLVLLDDIHLNLGMHQVWLSIPYPKMDVSTLHHSGFGMFYTYIKLDCT